MKKSFVEQIVDMRWLIIILFIGTTVLFALQLPKSQIDPDMTNDLSKEMPARMNNDKIEELYGGTDMVMIIVKTNDVLNSDTLKRVKKISKQMKYVKGIDKVMSLFELKTIKGKAGAMIVDPAVNVIPKNKKEREDLRKELKENDLVYGSVVSEDFTVTAIIGLLKSDVSDKFIIAEIERLIKENPGAEETIIGGVPFRRLNVSVSMGKDLKKLLPLGLLITLLFLFFCFRQARGVLLPSLVVVTAMIISMGLMPMLGWKISVVTVLLPVILIAVANDYGIHMIAKYQESNIAGNNLTKREIALNMIKSLGKPVMMTGLTTIAGMLCISGQILISARRLGVLAAIGISFALIASLLFIPAIISLLPKGKQVLQESGKKHVLEKILEFFGTIVSSKPKKVLLFSVLFTLIVSLGIPMIIVDSDSDNYFPSDHPVVYSSNVVKSKMGGMFNTLVSIHGDIKDPVLLKKIDRMERDIKRIPEVTVTSSIARVVRQISRALNEKGEDGYDRIPDTREAVAQYFELYSMSGEPEDLEKMIDFPYQNALINARINTSSTPKLRSILNKVNKITKNEPEVQYIGGLGRIFLDLSDSVVNGQIFSLVSAVLIVALFLMILFRSIFAGLISAIPLALALPILFGLMGFMGIHLNMVTALLSSIMIGVGIDYTIHFLWRYKEERAKGFDYPEAAKQALLTSGRGIIFNAFSVIVGFSVLLTSNFLPVEFFGFLVIVSIFACLFGALVIVPSLVLLIKPKFLEPTQNSKNIEV